MRTLREVVDMNVARALPSRSEVTGSSHKRTKRRHLGAKAFGVQLQPFIGLTFAP
jgi:hypothetical protein